MPRSARRRWSSGGPRGLFLSGRPATVPPARRRADPRGHGGTMASAPGSSPDGEIPSPASEGGETRDLARTGASCPLSATLAAAPDPALVTTTTGTVVTVNDAFVSTWRCGTAGRLEGASLADDSRVGRRGAARRRRRPRSLLRRWPSLPARRIGDRAATVGPAAPGPGLLGREGWPSSPPTSPRRAGSKGPRRSSG